MRRPHNNLVRDAVEMLAARGFTPTISNGRKHPMICWVDEKGRYHLLVISRTPSDHRTRVNSLALLRRLLRTDQGKEAP